MTSTRKMVTAFLVGVVLASMMIHDAMKSDPTTNPPDWLSSWGVAMMSFVFLGLGTTIDDYPSKVGDVFKSIAMLLVTAWWILFPMANFGWISPPDSVLVQLLAVVVALICIVAGHFMLGLWIGQIIDKT